MGATMSSNMPPGVTEGMIPGNRPEDEADEIFFQEFDKRCAQRGISPGSDLWEDDSYIEQIRLACNMGFTQGFSEGRDEASISHMAEECIRCGYAHSVQTHCHCGKCDYSHPENDPCVVD
jgi:hypothetical protein